MPDEKKRRETRAGTRRQKKGKDGEGWGRLGGEGRENGGDRTEEPVNWGQWEKQRNRTPNGAKEKLKMGRGKGENYKNLKACQDWD